MDLHIYKSKLCQFCSFRANQPCELDCHVFKNHPEHFQSNLYGEGSSNNKQGNSLIHNKPLEQISESSFEFEKGSYFENYLSEYYLDAKDYSFKFPTDLISYKYDKIMDILQKELQEKRQYKLFLYINVTFSKYDIQSDSMIFTDPPVTFRSYNHSILHESMLKNILNTANKKLEAQVENFLMNQSGWSVHCINDFTLRILHLRQIKGGAFIPTPSELSSKEKSGSLLNIQNYEENADRDHEKCFLWCCLAKLHPVVGKNRNRTNRLVKTYKKRLVMSSINVTNLHFPMSINQIPTFLENNPRISLTIFGYNIDTHKPCFQYNYKKVTQEIILISSVQCFKTYIQYIFHQQKKKFPLSSCCLLTKIKRNLILH